ncbi:hypothetical protein IT408_04545 [Candidatus Uhrbacteria bacterium]|nr:hypothetical protein [Candidatus Uhrbacteria bacterium]
MISPLPTDFRDRPRLQRWWIHFLILIGKKEIKIECCESFRKEGKVACKGCATLYHKQSPYLVYRFLARVGKYRSNSTSTTTKM